ncbi:MAG: ATP-binding protein [Lachnospiraceae bacterium]|nr:ATP-binding protein [Lachnospiraceae bacterium]MDD3659334.1 ATP-binding protein [Lachnospiraceae bacterium]
MNLQRLMSQTRKAIDTYKLIEENDKIAIGISGGKDSLALLYALNGLKAFYPKKFSIYAVTVDLGFQNVDFDQISKICESLDVPYVCIKTEIVDIVFHDRNEKNPCSLCSKMRKGALNDKMKELGCNKIAYAHHKDDLIITMLLSMLYEGRFHTFSAKTYLDDTGLTVIRPLILTYEADIIGFINKYKIPVMKSPCPADGHTKREYAKTLLKQLSRENPGVKERMFSAISKDLLKG